MADEKERHKRVNDLLAQDSEINDAHMQEFRMQLEQRLADWERRQARLWRVICIAGIAYLFEMVFAFAYLNHVPADSQRHVVIPFFMALYWLTFLVLIYSAALYFGKYMPAIRRMRYDVQTVMISELQLQVLAIREELRSRKSGGDV